MGDTMLDQGDIGSAIAFYSQAAQRSPGAVAPLNRLGAAAFAAGDAEGAARAYRAALARDRNDREALGGLARALLAAGNPGEAEAVLTEWLGSGGRQDPLLQRLRGVALDQLGRHAEAVAVYEAALAAARTDIDLMTNLGLSRAASGQLDEAVALTGAVVADPRAQLRHFANHALVLAIAGREAEAARAVAVMLDAVAVRELVAIGQRARQLPPGPERARAIGLSRAMPPRSAESR